MHVAVSTSMHSRTRLTSNSIAFSMNISLPPPSSFLRPSHLLPSSHPFLLLISTFLTLIGRKIEPESFVKQFKHTPDGLRWDSGNYLKTP